MPEGGEVSLSKYVPQENQLEGPHSPPIQIDWREGVPPMKMIFLTSGGNLQIQ